MTRITDTGMDENGDIVYVAYGKDHALGWFVDVWKEPQSTKNNSEIRLFIECGDNDKNHCWCKFSGLILGQVKDKWGFGVKFQVALLETLEINYVHKDHETYEHSYPDIVVVYDDEINDPISNMVISKWSLSAREVSEVLSKYLVKFRG